MHVARYMVGALMLLGLVPPTKAEAAPIPASLTNVYPAPSATVAELPELVRAKETTFSVPPVEYGKWMGTGYGAYLAPKNLDVGADGGVDMMIHLNGAMMADKEWRESGLNAIVASIAIREVVGSAGYAKLFASPGYLDFVVRSTFADIRSKGEKRPLHLRRLGVVSWSAGMGGVGALLGNGETAQKIDSVVLLDSAHAPYADPKNGHVLMGNPTNPAMGRGVDWVDSKSIGKFVRFAEKAKEGAKALVMSSSSILPPDYASCAETIEAIMNQVHVAGTGVQEKNALGMTLKWKSDAGSLHGRMWRGGGPHDHFDQLHLVGEMMRSFVSPRWNRLAAQDRGFRSAGL